MEDAVQRVQINRYALETTDKTVRFLIDVAPGTHSEVNLIVQGVKDMEKFDFLRRKVGVIDLINLKEMIERVLAEVEVSDNG